MMVDWAVLNVMLLTRICVVVPPDNAIYSGRVIEFDNSTSANVYIKAFNRKGVIPELSSQIEVLFWIYIYIYIEILENQIVVIVLQNVS